MVEHDEERLRANLAFVPAGDALHGGLVRQIDADEQRIAALGQTIVQAEEASEAGA